MANLVRYYFRKLGANFVDFKLDYPNSNLSLIGSDVVYVGSSGVDRVYVAKGVKFTFNNSGTGTDEIYLDGSFADYSLTAIGTSTLLLTSTAKANTSITLASEDKVFFSDGSSGVKSLITYAAARIGTPSTPPPTLNTAENSLTLPSTSNLDSILRAYTKDPAGVVFAQPHAGVEFILTGHNGVDKVYVSKGGKVNANNLGTGVDLIYLTGNKNEYSPTAVGTSVLVLTKGTERVTLASEDRVIFADGSTLVKAAITAASGANWQALSLDSNTRTPGLVTDTQAPAMPTLALGAGVSGGATAAEATAATGVVSVLAESGSTVLLTFSDSASPMHTLVKTLTGNGSAQSVQLDSTDIGTNIGTGPASLQDGSITISATATDAAGNISSAGTASFTLDTLAPSISSSATATIAENAGAAQVVYTALATDQGAISYSIKPNTGDASAFSIDSSTGAVTLTANPDFETKSSYSFTVVATDAAGNNTEKPVTLAITNVDEVGPVFSSSATATAIAENSGAGQAVYNAAATDSDFNAPATASSVTYTLKANTGDASAFSINSSTGVVTLTANPDFETKSSYSFTVVATDAAGNNTEKPVTLAISNVDEVAPVFSSSATATAIAENSGAGQVVYTAAATDSDFNAPATASSVTYSLKANTGDASAFSINSSTGAVTLTANPNYETKSSYSFTVVATDAAGNNTEKPVTLAITNVDEVAPVFSSSGTATAIAENSGAGQEVYNAAATDSDFNAPATASSVTYTLKANTGDASAFSINSSTGVVTLTANPDFETKSSYSFTVVATDAAGNNTEKPVTLAITNVDEVAPVFSSSGTATAIAENSSAGQAVYNAAATDSDFNAPATASSVTYSLKANTGDASAFSINSSTGVVTLTASPDFETKSSYSFTVVATDAAGNNTEKPVTLAITNVDEVGPVFSSSATATAIAENSGAGQVVYTAAATDSDFNSPNTASSVTYTLKANTGDASAFSINSSTGVVTLTANPNYETKSSYSFTVVATDAAGNNTEKPVTLAITNVDEVAPVFSSSATATAIAENSGAGQAVYNAAATDSDFNAPATANSVTYTLKANTGDDSAFSIDSSTGAVTLTANPNYETKSSYSFTVVATDAAGNNTEKPVTLAISNVDEVGPVFSSSATATAIAENSGAGQAVYNAAATDSDFNAPATASSVTYTLKANTGDASAFSINSSTGAVTLTASPDFETKSSYSFTVVATDAAGNNTEKPVTLAISNVDEVAPVFSSSATATAIAENSGAGQAVYNAAATDSDFNAPATASSVTYSLKANTGDASAFSINSSTGAVTLTASPDFETKSSYSFTVVATDAAGNNTEKPVTLAITNVDEVAPVFSSSATATAIAENSSAGQAVYNAAATDSDFNAPATASSVTYTLKANTGDASAFSINSSTGVVTLTANPDFETKSSYSFTVVATDAAGNNTEKPVTLAITNVDEVGPVFSSSATATAIAENSGAGQAVYNAAATDSDFNSPNTANSVTYTLKANTGDANAFSIDSSTGVVTLTASPDFETKSSYSFTVVATDAAGNNTEKPVTLAISNVDEVAPTFSSGSTATAIAENSGPGQVVYNAAATDSDFNVPATASSVTYSLKANTGDANAFSINSSTGVVTLTASPDFETKSSYSFTVVATDAAGNNTEKPVTLAITNVDEVGPVFSSSGNATAIAENSGAGQVVYTAAATDSDFNSPNTASSVTYSLKANTGDASAFSINSSTGVVTLTANPDYETKSSYSFTVVATDAAGNNTEKPVTLAITNVDEVGPVFSSSATATAIAENSGAGQVVYTANASDTDFISPNTANSVTYSLKSGGDASAFSINSSTGAVTLTANPNHETKSSYSFTVVATDAAGNPAEKLVTLAISNVNEAPTVVVPQAAVTVNEDSSVAIAGISVSDVDAGVNGIASVQLAVAHGTLSVSANVAHGLTAENISGNNSASITLIGTQAAINATLASLGYLGNANFNGTDTLSVQSRDGGNPAKSSSNSLAINVTAVNDAPSISGIPADTVDITNAVASALADFSVYDVDGTDTMLYVTLEPSNGSIGGFTDGMANGLSTSITGNTVQLSGTAALINTALAAASFTASAAGTASIAVRVSDVSVTDIAAATSSSASYRFNVVNTPVLSISSGQDATINSTESGVDVEVLFSNLANGDTVQLKLDGNNIGSLHTVSISEAAAHKASFTIAKGVLGVDGSKTVSAEVTHGSDPAAATNALTLTLDTTAPGMPSLALGSGVSNGATSAEALAGSGVVTVNAENGSSVAVTFTDSASHSVIKMLTGTGSALAVTLGSADITGANNLQDGSITVSASATDAAGNTSAADSSSFTLDTSAPSINSATTLTVAENTTAVATLSATDSISSGGLIWSLESGGTDNALFNLDSSGVLSFKTAPDYEDATHPTHAYNLTVGVTDGAGNKQTQAIRVNLSDVNEAPTVKANAPDSKTFITGSNAVTLNLSDVFSDVDAGDTLSYSLDSGTLPSGLTLVNGILSGTPAANATGGSFSFSADDGHGHTVSKTIQINVATRPKVSSIAVFDSGTGSTAEAGKQGDTVMLDLTLNETVSFSGTPSSSNLVPVFSAAGAVLTGITYLSHSTVDGKTVLHFSGTLPGGTASSVVLTGLALSGGLTITGTTSNQTMDASQTGLSIGDSYTLDNTAPTLSISSSKSALKAGETANITFTFSEDPGDSFAWDGSTGDVSVSGGTLGNLSGSGTTRTATFTPTAATNNGSASISVAAGSYTDAAGNSGGSGSTPTITFDTNTPVAPVFAFGAGVSDGATAAEALAGAVTVLAESGSSVAVTFTDSASHSVIKMLTGSGAALAVTLDSSDIGTDASQLLDGSITVSATASDAAGNVSAVATRSFTLDTTAPSIGTAPTLALLHGNAAATSALVAGDNIVLTIPLGEAATGLTGLPSGSNSTVIKLDSTGKNAVWSSSGNNLLLSYTVQPGDSGSISVDAAALKTALGSAISDTAGNAVTLGGSAWNSGSFSTPPNPAITVDAAAPTVSGIRFDSKSDTTHSALNVGDSVDVAVTFSEAVSISGNPRIALTIGSGTANASYISGDARNNGFSSTKYFRYTVQAGDTDANGLSIAANALTLNGGNISDSAGNAAALTHALVVDNNAFSIDTTAPTMPTLALGSGVSGGATAAEATVSSGVVTVNAENGSTVLVTFSDSASPVHSFIKTVIGTGAALAVTLESGDIGSGAAKLLDGSISVSTTATDAAGNVSAVATRSFTLDTGTPNIEAAPSLALLHGNAAATSALVAGDNIVLTIPLGEAATGLAGLPSGSNSTVITLDSTGKNAVWSSSGNNLLLSYTVQPGDSGSISVDAAALKTALGSAISDTAGNAVTLGGSAWNSGVFTAPTAPALTVNAPAVLVLSSFAVSDSGNSNGSALGKGGEAVDVAVTFSESVTLTANKTYTVHVQIGSNASDGFDAVLDTTASGLSASSSYTFTGTLPSSSGLSSNALQLTLLTVPAGADIHSTVSNLVLTQSIYSLSSSAYTVDTTSPTVTGLAFDSKSDNTYSALNAGDTVDVAVTFSEAVSISGSPRIALTVGSGTAFATYDSSIAGNTSSTKYFRYTVQAGDTDANGLSIAANALALNDGSISDAAGNAATLTHAAVADNSSYSIDTIAPTLPTLTLGSGVSGVANAAEATASSGVVTVNAELGSSVAVTFTDSASHSVIKMLTGTGSALAVTLGSADITGANNLQDGSITVSASATDAAGNTSAADSSSFTLDTSAPSINSATTLTVAENTTAVATLSATDSISSGGLIWSLESGGTDNALFNLDSSGVLSFKTAPDYEDATRPTHAYNLTVGVTDGAGNKQTQAIRVNLSDVNEAPTVKANAPDSKTFITGSNAVTLNLSDVFSDVDAGDTLSYSLDSGTLPSGLTLVNGILSGTPAANATGGSFSFSADDGHGHTVSKTIQINVATRPKVSSIAVFDSGTGSTAEAGKQGDTVMLDLTLNETVSFSGTPSSSNLVPVFSAAGAALTGISYLSHSTVDGKTVLHFSGTLPGGTASSVVLTGLALSGGLTITGTTSNQTMDASQTGLSIGDSYTLDNTAPTLSISSSKSALKAGETANITFTFSEDPGDSFAWDGSTGDVSVSGGTLGNLSGSGTTRTATFTPTAATNNGSASISVAAGSYTDAAGNSGGSGSTPTITFDTNTPVAPVFAFGAGVSDGATAAEALAGAVTVLAESGSSVAVTFTDSASHSVIKMLTGSGAALAVTLDSSDIGTDASQLLDGSITVSATASDAAGNVSAVATRSFTLDTTAPSIGTAPTLALLHGNAAATSALVAGDNIVLTIPLGEAATGLAGLPSGSNSTVIKLDSTGKNAVWSSSGNNLLLSYTVQPGDSGSISVDAAALKTALGSAISDTAGNAVTLGGSAWNSGVFTAPTAPALTVNAPAVLVLSSFAVSDSGNSNGSALGKGGEAVDVAVTFSESVTLTANKTYTVHVQIGSNASDGFDAVLDTTASGLSASSSYTFTGTLPSSSGLSSNALQLTLLTVPAGADIHSTVSNLVLTQSIYSLSSSAYTVDTTSPTVTGLAFDSKSDNTYSALNAGDTVDVAVTFSEAVSISGSPRIALTVGSGTAFATYDSSIAGNTSSTKYFRYTVQAGDTDANGLSIAANALALNDGSISDAAGNAATLTHAAVADNSSYSIDTIAPTLPTLTLGSGVSGVANAAEATASSGVVTVNAELGSTVLVTFSDSASPIHSFIKTLTGTGAALAVVLAASDIGTGASSLQDGSISVSTSASDAAGNVSPVGSASFNLDAAPVSINSLPGSALNVGVGVNTDLADLVFSKAGANGSTAVLNLTVTASNGSVSGLTDADAIAPGIQLTGTAAALGGAFAAAQFQPSGAGAPALTLTLGDAAGNSVSRSYPLNLVDLIAPVLDLNGAASGVNQDQISNIGNTAAINLPGGLAGSAAPFLDLPDVLLGGDLTLEAWVNFSALFGWERVFDIGNAQGNNNLILGVQADGRVSSSVRNGNTASDVIYNTTLVTGQWYHLALRVSSSNQTVFINGVQEATSGALPSGYSILGALTRLNTWVGKSNWGADAFSNMQIRDVRVFDDARTDQEISSDMSGTAVDTSDPELRLAYKLNGNLQSSTPGRAAATLVNLLTGDLVYALTPNALLTETNNVQSVQISVSGVLNAGSEFLVVAGTSIPANGAVASGTVTLAANGAIAASTWTWAYVAGAAAGTGTFTLSAAAGGVSSSAAQGLLQSLAYVNVATTPSAGSRGFSITATDVSGNTSTAVSASLNSLQKSQPDLDSSSNGNDFSSSVNVSLLNAQGSAIAPNTAALTSDSSVSRIEVRIASAGLDLVNDKIVLSGPAAGANPVTVALNAPSASSNDISIGGIGGLRYSYSQPVNNGSTSNLLLITSSTGSIATADVDDIVKALLFNTALVSPVTSARSFQVSVVNAAGVSASSTATLTLVDNVIPVTPTLTLGSGVSGGATLAEATASSGVVSVNAESGSTVLVTFSDSASPVHSFIKTVVGTGAALAVTLESGDIGSGAAKLLDGSISVSTTATDAAGNVSAVATRSFTLDTGTPNIEAAPTLALMHGNAAATSTLVAGDSVVLTIPLGEAATGLTGLPSGSNSTVIKLDSTGKNAVWSSSGNNLLLSYTVQPGDSGSISVDAAALKTALGSAISDTAGNAVTLGGSAWNSGIFTAPAAPALTVNAPALVLLSSFAVSDSGNSNGSALGKGGEAVDVAVTFSESVTLTANKTYTVHVQIGSNASDGFDAVLDTTASGLSASSSYTFTGTLPSSSGLSSNALQLTLLTVPAGADIHSTVSNLVLTQSIYSLSSNAYTVDTTSPTVTGLAFDSKSDNTYSALNAGDTVDVAVTFSEAVSISGSPRIALTVGSGTAFATYDSSIAGNTSSKKFFRYTVQAGDTDANGLSITTNALALNNGSINDTAGNAATLTHALVADNNAFRIDTTAPNAPTLVLGSGVSGGVSAAEATASSGVITVNAESGSLVLVTFSDSASPAVHSFIKTVTSTGAALAVVLAASEIGTGVSSLEDGSISVSATATDATGNVSPVSSASFNLDAAPVSINSLPGSALNVGVGVNTDLADLVFSKAGANGSTAVLSLTVTASNGSVSGLTDADAIAPGIQLTGTAATLGSAFARRAISTKRCRRTRP